MLHRWSVLKAKAVRSEVLLEGTAPGRAAWWFPLASNSKSPEPAKRKQVLNVVIDNTLSW